MGTVGTAWARYPQTAAELQEALGASAAGRTGVRPYARSNSGQARMCCRQVALDAEVRLHARRKGPCLCDGGNSKMDLLCKTSDAARAGLQVGGQARPDRTRRDAMGVHEPIGPKRCHTVQYSRVQSDYGNPRILQGRGVAGWVRGERPGSWMSALRWRSMQRPSMDAG